MTFESLRAFDAIQSRKTPESAAYISRRSSFSSLAASDCSYSSCLSDETAATSVSTTSTVSWHHGGQRLSKVRSPWEARSELEKRVEAALDFADEGYCSQESLPSENDFLSGSAPRVPLTSSVHFSSVGNCGASISSSRPSESLHNRAPSSLLCLATPSRNGYRESSQFGPMPLRVPESVTGAEITQQQTISRPHEVGRCALSRSALGHVGSAFKKPLPTSFCQRTARQDTLQQKASLANSIRQPRLQSNSSCPRSNPRRSSHTQSWCPPSLVTQSSRRHDFVEHLVDSAAQLIGMIWPTSATAVAGKSAMLSDPIIPLRLFIRETLRRSRTSYSTLQVTLYYLATVKSTGRLPVCDFTKEQKTDDPSFRALQCGRRMFLAGLILASKYLQDRNYSARAWSKISGLAVHEINLNEMALLKALDWKLHVKVDIFHRWSDMVTKCTDSAQRRLQCPWEEVLKQLPLQSDEFASGSAEAATVWVGESAFVGGDCLMVSPSATTSSAASSVPAAAATPAAGTPATLEPQPTVAPPAPTLDRHLATPSVTPWSSSSQMSTPASTTRFAHANAFWQLSQPGGSTAFNNACRRLQPSSVLRHKQSMPTLHSSQCPRFSNPSAMHIGVQCAQQPLGFGATTRSAAAIGFGEYARDTEASCLTMSPESIAASSDSGSDWSARGYPTIRPASMQFEQYPTPPTSDEGSSPSRPDTAASSRRSSADSDVPRPVTSVFRPCDVPFGLACPPPSFENFSLQRLTSLSVGATPTSGIKRRPAGEDSHAERTPTKYLRTSKPLPTFANLPLNF